MIFIVLSLFSPTCKQEDLWKLAQQLDNADECIIDSTPWTKTLSGSSSDTGSGIATMKTGETYITGNTNSSLFNGQSTTGGYDAFLSKYGTTGSHLWTKILTGSSNDYGNQVAVDSIGNAYIVGRTSSNPFNGQSISGTQNVFISKYDSNGNHLWTIIPSGTGSDIGYSIALDGMGFVYITGNATSNPFNGQTTSGSQDVFISKYDTSGNYYWTKILSGSSTDEGFAISVDNAGNAYITGNTTSTTFNGQSASGSQDAYIAKYDTSGNHVWTRILSGTANDNGYGIMLDGRGYVYISGFTNSNPFNGQTASGTQDAFISKYDLSGNHSWTTILSGSGTENAVSPVIDRSGNVIVVGTTNSNPFNGQTASGTQDAFISKYDSSGNHLLTKVVTGASTDWGTAMSSDCSNNIYITGLTSSNPFNGLTTSGTQDVFIIKNP